MRWARWCFEPKLVRELCSPVKSHPSHDFTEREVVRRAAIPEDEFAQPKEEFDGQ